MNENWNPLAEPPDGQDADGLRQWLHDQLSAFQKTNSEVPQGALQSLSDRRVKELVRAYNRAREHAQLEKARKTSPQLYRIVKKGQRTRTITLKPSKK